MSARFKIYLILVLVSSCYYSANCQILRDSSSIRLVKREIDCIYNFNFSEANKVLKEITEQFPDHPAIYLIKGMNVYWENYPLLPNSPARASFEENMKKCIDIAAKKHDTEDGPEYLLTNLSARGMLLLFYSDNDLSLDVISMTPATYQLIRRAFDYTGDIVDFHFFTGLYNYYREAYPEAYPVYKPLALLFPRGDRAGGLKELQLVARKSILLRAESYSYLTGIYLSFEYNFQMAYAYSKSLHELYPDNLEFLGLYIKNLLLVKNYELAEQLIKSVSGTNNSYLKAQILIFNGIIQEKKYNNYKLAEDYYLQGVDNMSLFGIFGNEFEAYGYFGLSRLSDARGDKYYKKTYYKKATELADFKKVDFSD